VAAAVQHADAVKLIGHLENRIIAEPGYCMTYSEAAEVLGRKAASDARHVGQVTSRIDAACFYAKTPFLAMHRVRETHSGTINQRSFGGDLWRPFIPALVARAEAHAWSAADFQSIRRNLQSLGDDAAKLLWKRIESFGEKGVQKALGL
jgi:alkylated DNA nucleotide flippase Atl1